MTANLAGKQKKELATSFRYQCCQSTARIRKPPKKKKKALAVNPSRPTRSVPKKKKKRGKPTIEKHACHGELTINLEDYEDGYWVTISLAHRLKHAPYIYRHIPSDVLDFIKENPGGQFRDVCTTCFGTPGFFTDETLPSYGKRSSRNGPNVRSFRNQSTSAGCF